VDRSNILAPGFRVLWPGSVTRPRLEWRKRHYDRGYKTHLFPAFTAGT
jgi:hypothetical protein